MVMSLVNDYLDKGHNLYMDNWYSSPRLFEEFYQQRTRGCGTVRKNRKALSKFDEKLERGQQVFKHTEHFLALKWHDKRDVLMLSTIHTADAVFSEKLGPGTMQKVMKPLSVVDYNKNMEAIGLSDLQIVYSESVKKSMTWYRKFFFHLLDKTVLNAFILSKMAASQTMQLLDFRLQIIQGII